MSYETIRLDINDGVAKLTLNRPDKLNSFTLLMHKEVADAINRVEEHKSVRALLITGSGNAFCAGQDLSERKVSRGETPVDLGASIEKNYAPLIERLTTLPMPVVCGLNGVAAGAGVSIALAADIVIAAKSAKFVLSFSKLGLIPDSGASWVLPRMIGQARALGLALTGDPISAQQAEAYGLIWRSVEDDEYLVEIDKIMSQFSQAPTRGLSETKQLIRSAFSFSLKQQMVLEMKKMRELGFSTDYQEGVSSFLQKRKPAFTGE